MGFDALTKGQLSSDAMVVDNSVIMRWVFNDGSEADQQYAQNVLNYIETNKPQVIVPYIWVYEASFVVNYYTKKEMISFEEGMAHLNSLFDFCSVIRGEETPSDLFKFSNTHGLTTYDASYAMLALQQTLMIATLDKEIIRVSGTLDIEIFA